MPKEQLEQPRSYLTQEACQVRVVPSSDMLGAQTGYVLVSFYPASRNTPVKVTAAFTVNFAQLYCLRGGERLFQ